MFKVGDIITGTEKSLCYAITTPKAIMEVVSLGYDECMNVKILEHQTRREEVGAIYGVRNDLEYFKLIKVKKSNMKGW